MNFWMYHLNLLESGDVVVAPHPSYVLHSFSVKINGGCSETVDLLRVPTGRRWNARKEE